ncbi:MAG: hypothetical protein U0527_12750 [Candidatus Eisenbacteria bacterium]
MSSSRLHLRYDFDHFPEDLVFQETGDRENFQGRYVLRHPWTGSYDCEAAREYRRDLRDRERQAEELASLTSWDLEQIRQRMGGGWDDRRDDDRWWDRIWKRFVHRPARRGERRAGVRVVETRSQALRGRDGQGALAHRPLHRGQRVERSWRRVRPARTLEFATRSASSRRAASSG